MTVKHYFCLIYYKKLHGFRFYLLHCLVIKLFTRCMRLDEEFFRWKKASRYNENLNRRLDDWTQGICHNDWSVSEGVFLYLFPRTSRLARDNCHTPCDVRQATIKNLLIVHLSRLLRSQNACFYLQVARTCSFIIGWDEILCVILDV